MALDYGHLTIVESLINAHANVSITKQNGWTALHYAARYNRTDIAVLLLNTSLGADINAQTNVNDGRTPLIMATWEGYLTIVEALINAHANVSITQQDGWTALHYAARYNRTDIAVLLLNTSLDVDINAQTNLGYTPLMDEVSALHTAARYNRTAIAVLLLEQGADSTKRDKYGRTPAGLARYYGYHHLADIIDGLTTVNTTPADSALTTPSHHFPLSTTSAATPSWSSTPVTTYPQSTTPAVTTVWSNVSETSSRHWSIQSINPITTPILQPTTTTTTSDLHLQIPGIIVGVLVMVLLVVFSFFRRLQNRGDGSGTYANSEYPMNIITHSDPGNGIENILFESVNTAASQCGSAHGRETWPPLMIAVVEGNCNVADFLIKCKGASVEMGVGEHSTPPLVEGAWQGHLEMCRLLLQHGANPDAADSKGFHGIYVAAQNGNQEIIQVIIDYGGDPQLPRTGSIHTAANHARNNGHHELANWLDNKRKLTMRKAKDVGQGGTYVNESGLVVLLNYVRFREEKNYRKGADKDKENIITTFKSLHYSIDYHEDLYKYKTISVLENLRKDQRLWYKDSLILIINSHGLDRKSFVTSDGNDHDINLIKLLFTNTACPQLKNKPKVFIINCCRGKNKEMVKRPVTNDNTDNASEGMKIETMNDAEAVVARTRPLEIELPTNMAVITSSSEGVISTRSPQNGSYFIQCLCEALKNKPGDDMGLVIDTVADMMKEKKKHHPTDLYERPFRRFVFELQD
ncbi:unnamed protein product, partial [Meganyctiphanes norvegica]